MVYFSFFCPSCPRQNCSMSTEGVWMMFMGVCNMWGSWLMFIDEREVRPHLIFDSSNVPSLCCTSSQDGLSFFIIMKFTPNIFRLSNHQVSLGFVRICGPGHHHMSGMPAKQGDITFLAGHLLPVSHQPHQLSLLGSLVRLGTGEQRSDDA